MTASVSVLAVVVAASVGASPTVATLLLLGAAVGVVVKGRAMQTSSTVSSRAAQMYWSPARLAQKLGLYVARTNAEVTASLESQKRRHS